MHVSLQNRVERGVCEREHVIQGINSPIKGLKGVF
jgi:hypothetical protein